MLEVLHARLREAAQRLIDEVSAEEMIDLLPEARRRALLQGYTLRTRRTLLANDLTADERVAALQDCLASERTESGILRARVSVLENALAAFCRLRGEGLGQRRNEFRARPGVRPPAWHRPLIVVAVTSGVDAPGRSPVSGSR